MKPPPRLLPSSGPSHPRTLVAPTPSYARPPSATTPTIWSLPAFTSEAPTPPYFLSYEVTETERTVVSGAFGALRASFQNRTRQLDVDLRVGNYSFDNTRPVRGRFGRGGFGGRTGFVSVPIDDDSEAIRSVLWRSTDSAYRRAVEEFIRLQSNLEVTVAAEDRSGDFSREEPLQLVEPVIPVQVDRAVWEQKVRKYSAPFSEYGNIFAGSVSLSVTGETRWHVSSEGSEIRTSQGYYRLVISAYTKAHDGMELPRYESFFASLLPICLGSGLPFRAMHDLEGALSGRRTRFSTNWEAAFCRGS